MIRNHLPNVIFVFKYNHEQDLLKTSDRTYYPIS